MAPLSNDGLSEMTGMGFQGSDWMMISRLAGLVMACLLLVACAEPLPDDRLDYAGYWTSEGMALLITRDGSVSYKRLKEGVTTSINGPLKAFHGDSFEVGVGPMATTFEVSEPPHAVGDSWQMVVDGVRLTRAPEPGPDWL